MTVEASSPALIEGFARLRFDGPASKIVDLRPGTYSSHLYAGRIQRLQTRRIELTGSFAATVNAELKVGTVQETITVTGESPIVDVRTRAAAGLGADVIDAIPTSEQFDRGADSG